jgi:alkyl hydroperoxide reductase subunit AhpC
MGNSWFLLLTDIDLFSPVCSGELLEIAKLKTPFLDRNVKVVALIPNTPNDQADWLKEAETALRVPFPFPLISDPDLSVCKHLGIVAQDDKIPIPRTVLLVDPNKKIRSLLQYPDPVGRSLVEILRLIDALQLTEKYPVATPVNWNDGNDVYVLPQGVDKKKLDILFPTGVKQINPFTRITQQPNK